MRFLFDLRTLPDRLRGLDVPLAKDSGLGVDDIASHGHGFMLLDERPGEEVVVGAIGQFWHLNIPFKDVPPPAFGRFAEPGWGKVAWCIRVEPREAGSWVTLELRVTATDDTSWRKQTAYFRLIGPFSHLIRSSGMAHLEAQLGKATSPSDDDRSLTGDEILPDAPYVLTRGIDIEAPPSPVWPWLMQLGCDRGGWYSIDALDHGGEPSVEELRPEWTERHVGDTVHATPALDGGYTVWDIQREHSLVLGAETDRMGGHVRTTWSFVLDPIGSDASRLITRVRGTGTPPWSAWLQGAALFPPVHALMQRAQLKHLKELAEASAWACTGFGDALDAGSAPVLPS